VAIVGETFVKDLASLEKSKAMISNLTMVPFVLLISSVCCLFPTIADIYG
jgi:hypothetical protein